MKKLISVLAICLMGLGCSKESTDKVDQTALDAPLKVTVETVYRPMIHHFSSTGCGPCGRWGIPTFDRVAEMMGDTILPLITHFKYNDPFITSSSMAIEQALLNEWYSPQIWVDNENRTFPFIYDDIETAAQKYAEVLRQKLDHIPSAFVGISSRKKSNGRFDIKYTVSNNLYVPNDLYVQIYAMEDGIVASQAGADPFVKVHTRVNRGGFYPGMGKEIKLNGASSIEEEIEFVPCSGCNADAQYFYIILWKEVSEGRFEYVNGLIGKS